MLQGGGMRGAYGIGALSALEDEGLTEACVDGPCIARKIYLIAISVGCAHVSGLLMRYYNRWP